MAWWNEVWKIINSERVSTGRSDAGHTTIRDSLHFKALSFAKQERINNILENEQKRQAQKVLGKSMDSLNDIKKRSSQLVPLILNNYKSSRPLSSAVMDSIYSEPFSYGGIGGMSNPQTMINVSGQDPNTFNRVQPNVWISPYEAAAVYSQKGLPETILRKKSLSIHLNGVKIRNPKLTPKQMDIIHEDMIKNDFTKHIVNGILWSLIYGGSLLFPMFKKDTPATMGLPVSTLIKYGIVGKGCIDYFVSLDRWNAMHIPNWNPTARDFFNPKLYFIPFLGTDISGERCARIVTAPQAGYWGVLLTLGWGISDIPGWIESVYNYYNVMNTIPTMINQMSILARTFNVDGILATEGTNILNEIDLENTVKVRQMSANNPVALDVIGTLQAIQRDFKEVPNLVRLIRQDVGGRANIPEELLWSSERGAFSSGDTTEGALEKQWESIKYLHKDVAYALKTMAMFQVINALGLGRDVMQALPYTVISFDNPITANAIDRSDIAKNLGQTAFDFTAAGFPSDAVAEIVSSYGDDEFSVRSDLLEDLKKRQKIIDARAEEKHTKEMELLDAQIELTREQADNVGVAPMGGSSGGGGKAKVLPKGEGYSKLEQRQKETTRGASTRRQGLQKAQNKKLR